MKRLTSIFLVIAMIFTLAPMNIMAADAVSVGSEQIENMTQEEYALWKQNLVSQNSVSTMSIDSFSEGVEDDYSANTGNYIRNDFIEAYINSSGHYTMGTTGGNPDSESDNNKLLLFGHPDSTTTETLIKIDDEETYFYSNDTVFNSEGTQAITTATINDVEVKQIITLETNTYTGNADVASIKYIMTNNSSQTKQIGGRIMLDTMLGNNDGAPFRIPGIGNVTSEIELSGNDIPEYWQAFDNLTTPNVISTGNFYRTVAEKPDKVQFAAWPGIQGSSWNYRVTAGHSVTGDSAVAAYFNPRTVLPGQSRTIVTYYGISDFSSSDVEDDITLRVSAPSFLGGNNAGYLNNPFVVTAYIGNYTSSTVNNITARISLPEELQIEGSDSTTKNIGSISSGTETFTKWTVRAIPQETGKTITYNITINGEGIDEKTIPVSLNLHTTNDLYRDISFNLNGGDGVAPQTQRVLVGTKGTEPEKPTRTGYIFKGWYANPQCTGISWFSFLNVGALLRTTDNITLYAKWVENEELLYGRNTFNFENTDSDFFGAWNNSNLYRIYGDYYDILLENQSNDDYLIDYMNNTGYSDSSWGGSCFGMSCVLALFKAGKLDVEFFQPDASNTYELTRPRDSKTIFNLVNYYHIMQLTPTTNNQRSDYDRRVETSNNRRLVERLQNSSNPVVLGFDINAYGSRRGGHAVVAYDLIETDSYYDVQIWDPNDKETPVSLHISKDYTTSEFQNYCFETSPYSTYLKYAFDIENSETTYDYRNIESELRLRGRNNGVETASLLSLLPLSVEPLNLILNYSSFTIESSNGETATVVNGEKTEGDIDIEYVDILNNIGEELSIMFEVPNLDGDEYYIISPAEQQNSVVTDQLLTTYSTILYADDGFYTRINAEGNGDFKIYANGKISSNTDSECEQSIAMSDNVNGDTVLISFDVESDQIDAGYNNNVLTINTNSSDTNSNISIYDEYNLIEFEDVDTSNGIELFNADRMISLYDSDNNFITEGSLGYAVVFYSLGGTVIESIANVADGSTVVKPEDPTREGFIFDGWYLSTAYNENEKWNFDSDVVEDNVRLYAKWLPDENYMHSVTFKSENNDDIIVLVRNGETLTDVPEVPERPGYNGQWDISDFSNITSNMIVYAIYAEQTAIKPVASPLGGTYYSAQSVALTTETQNGKIYYTIDGSTPTAESTLYTQPITVASTLTLKAITIKDGIPNSDVMTETYTITSPPGGGGGGGGTLSYKITVTQGENGTISPSSANVNRNEDETFTITANEGYEIEDVIVNGESVGAVTSYTFEKVTKAATITAKFKKVEETKDEWKNPFNDVNENDWFYEAVKFASEKGITSGVSNNKFAPNDKVTRAQFITMLCRAYGIEEMTGDNFDDCGNTWYTGYLAAAKQLGISNGVEGNTFAPEREITREEMVTLIYNYLKSIGEVDVDKEETSFKDNDSISDWAKAGVAFASDKGYVNGKENNLFDPTGDATRAELAQIFFNMFK